MGELEDKKQISINKSKLSYEKGAKKQVAQEEQVARENADIAKKHELQIALKQSESKKEIQNVRAEMAANLRANPIELKMAALAKEDAEQRHELEKERGKGQEPAQRDLS